MMVQPVWQKILFSCTHMATVGVKGINQLCSMVSLPCACWKMVNESIADEKTSCVECFASVALCDHLRRADADPAVSLLLKQRPLDPFREQQMKSIRSARVYVDREIMKADAALDDRWQEYQRQRQNKKYVGFAYNKVVMFMRIYEY